MRISKRRGWLAVAALAWGTAKGDPTVTFSGFEGDFDNHVAAIFNFDSIAGKVFRWTTTGVSGNEVQIFLYADQNGDAVQLGQGPAPGSGPPSQGAQDSHTITPSLSTPTVAPTETTSVKSSGIPVKRGGDPLMTLLVIAPSGGSDGQVHLPARGLFSPEVGSGTALYFQAIWPNGKSNSRLFTVATSDSDYHKVIANDVRFWSSSLVPLPESSTSSGSSLATGTSTTAPGTASTTFASPSSSSSPSTGEQSPDISGIQPPSSPASPAKSAGSNGGLSTGAIIGIAVGCGVAGLALAVALIWCLMRRRDQRKDMLPGGSAYGPGHRPDDLMAEKEAAADVDGSPHSPYSDESALAAGPSGGAYQQDGAAHGEPVAAGAAGGLRQQQQQHSQDRPRSYTPYSDRPGVGSAVAGTPSVRAASLAQADETFVSVPSTTPGRATPRALTTPYAHLVEDGMTEDEIRRLEEEERQLDAAIEQAGRR